MAERRQREPLRVPEGWSGQNRSFVVQLERVLDDIYAQLGRIRDESAKLEERVAALEEE